MNAPDARWSRVRAIVEEALELPREHRSEFVARASDGDDELRADVERLLRADDEGGSLGLPAPETLHGWLEEHLSRLVAGRRIGSFRLRRILATGGMGTVYEAEQDAPRRLVALKMLRAGITSPLARRRLQWETEVLAHMQHPGIAQVFEAGVHEEEIDGRRIEVPYFAMELVEGASTLIAYANQHRLGTTHRLRLLRAACDAIQEAHRRGVIHRDVKPGNLLVSAAGRVKVIDFGVARAVTSAAVANTATADGIVGTLRYTSPEQLTGDPRVLDVRADVYSLGVVAYELLSGEMPYADVRALLRAEPPVPLGARGSRLRGDLERIVHKAIHPDREQRYGSAGELGADLERFLAKLPVVAGPPGVAYRLRKLIARHSLAAGSVLVAFVTAVAGGVVAASSWLHARQQREQAVDEAAHSAAMFDFMREILVAAHPYHRGPDVTVGELLVAAAARIDDSLARRPQLAAQLHHIVGATLRGTGSFESAVRHYRRAWELSANADADADPRARAMIGRDLASLLADVGQVEEGVQVAAEASAFAARAFGAEHGVTEAVSVAHAMLLSRTGHAAEAVQVLTRLFEASRASLGPDDPETLARETNLIGALVETGRFDDAERHARHAHEQSAAQFGREHPKTQVTAFNHAHTLIAAGDAAQAEAILVDLVALREDKVGAAHPNTALARRYLARALAAQQRWQEAEAILAAALREIDAGGAETEWVRVDLRLELADVAARAGRHDEARTRIAELRASHGEALTERRAAFLQRVEHAVRGGEAGGKR